MHVCHVVGNAVGTPRAASFLIMEINRAVGSAVDTSRAARPQ